MSYIKESKGQQSQAPVPHAPAERPAPKLKNRPTPSVRPRNPNRHLTDTQRNLQTTFGAKYREKTGRDLAANAGLMRALLESNTANIGQIRDAMVGDVQTRHVPKLDDPMLAQEFVRAMRDRGATPLRIAQLSGRLRDVGRSSDADSVQAAQIALDSAEALGRRVGPGRQVERGLGSDPVAEAVLGGLAGGVVGGVAKVAAKSAAERAAGGLSTDSALQGAKPALRYTVPTKSIAKHIIPNRPSIARPLADFAQRGFAERSAAGAGILAAAPATDKLASVAAQKAASIRGVPKVEVDPSELNPVGQAYAEGRKPTKQEIKASGALVHGPGRLGLSPSIRARLLHQARVNGWPIPDSVNDQELIAKAYKKNSSTAQRLTAGLVENAGNLAFVPSFAGALYDATKKSAAGGGVKPFVDIGQGMADATVNAAEHPIDNPLFAAGIYSGLVKGVGRTSAKALRVKPAALSMPVGEVNGQQHRWQYGVAAPNTLTRPFALAGQRVLASPRARGLRDAIIAKQAGQEANIITTRAQSAGGKAVRDLSKAINKLGKKQQVLAVWSHATGSSAANQAAYYAAKVVELERRKAGFTNSKGKPVPPRKVNEASLKSLRAKQKEWQQLAQVEANLSPKEKQQVADFGVEAQKIEATNQEILKSFGMSPDVMKERLWLQALEQHPELKQRVKDEMKARNAQVLAGPLAPGDPLRVSKDQVKGDVRQQIQDEMTAAGSEPKMFVPHSPVDAGPSTFISSPDPFLTSGSDKLANRFKQNTGETLRQGFTDERPSLAINAASKPSAVKSQVDDAERWLRSRAVELHVPTDRGVEVPEGYTIIRATREGKLSRKTVMRRGKDQAEFLRQHGLADKTTQVDLMSTIFDVVEPKNGKLPKGSYFAVPTPAVDAFRGHARTEAIRRGLAPGLRRVSQVTTGLMINTLPRTPINNLGSVAMSTLGGAGPLSHTRALDRTMRETIVPSELQGRGISGSQTRSSAAKEGNPLLRPGRAWQNAIRNLNVAAEDFPRAALAIKNVLHEAKQVQYGNSIKARMHRVNADTLEIAKGLRDTHPERYDAAVKRTIDWVGDLGHLSKLDPALQIASPFWRWNALILKSVLHTMPAHYPARATLLQAMGEVGREYEREHGVWPSWIRGAIDLGSDIPLLGGVKDKVTTVLPTSGIWPYATQTGVLAPGFDNVGVDATTPLQNLGPVVTLPLAAAGLDAQRFEHFKDANNNPIQFGSPEWKRLLESQALSTLPTPYSTSGQTTTSVPWDTQYKDTGLPRRGNSPVDIAMRAFGVGTTPVQVGGKPLLKQRGKAFKRATSEFSHLPIEDRRAMLGSWRHDGGETYSTIIDLGRGH